MLDMDEKIFNESVCYEQFCNHASRNIVVYTYIVKYPCRRASAKRNH